jgi:hypothetical protein
VAIRKDIISIKVYHVPSMINNNPTMFAIPAILLLLLSLLSFSSPSLTKAQQQTPGAATTTTTTPSPLTTGQTAAPLPTPPLTPQEQEQQTRLQNVIAATNQNLDEAEKQVGGVVYTPRWSDVVWVEPDSAAVLVAYCLPGEFAESGQEILGGFELEVLESYEVALPQNFTAWMMVIGNEDRQDRLPAAVGVVCASDANDAETRVVSPEEQQQINNVVQQFRTSTTTSIDQVINIINNATTPGTGTPTTPGGGGTPTTPGTGTPTITATANPVTYNGACGPSPLEFSGTITDNVGNRDVTYRFVFSTGATLDEQVIHFDQPGSQRVSYTAPELPPYSLEGWWAIEILQPVQLQSNQAEMRITCVESGDITAPPAATDTIPPDFGPIQKLIDKSSGQPGTTYYDITAQDNVDGTATLDVSGLTQDNVGGDITISCDPPSGSMLPPGVATITCTAIDAAGNGRTADFTLTIAPPPTLQAEDTAAPADGEPAAPADGEPAAPADGEPAAPADGEPAAEEEAATPADNGGG